VFLATLWSAGVSSIHAVIITSKLLVPMLVTTLYGDTSNNVLPSSLAII